MADKEATVAAIQAQTNCRTSGNGNKPRSVQHALIPSRDSNIMKKALVILRGGQETPQRTLELATRLKVSYASVYAR
ncbi:MAG TPA: hypothetical protein VKB05_03010 [Pyrinomonadaceae bacterium]|nr:hypothetical protein [Pyrinomonadaceae bacterium]